MARKSGGHEAKLAYCGNVMIENRNGLVVDAELLICTGTAERDAAKVMIGSLKGSAPVTVGASILLARGFGHPGARGQVALVAGLFELTNMGCFDKLPVALSNSGLQH